MSGADPEPVRRSSRERGDRPETGDSFLSGKERALLAAKAVLNQELKQADAADKWGLQGRMVHYYVRQLESAGYTPERARAPSPAETDSASVSAPSTVMSVSYTHLTLPTILRV